MTLFIKRPGNPQRPQPQQQQCGRGFRPFNRPNQFRILTGWRHRTGFSTQQRAGRLRV